MTESTVVVMTKDDVLPFEAVRLDSLAVFAGGHETFVWSPCNWHPSEGHSALACNVVSHLDSLVELLANATWCDDIDMNDPMLSVGERDEQLFRLYGIVHLVIDQIVFDLRLAAKAIAGELLHDVEEATKKVMGDINRIWKHRNMPDNRDPSHRTMHRDHHHGPYTFVDAGASTAPSGGLLVPSLIQAVIAVDSSLDKIDQRRAQDPDGFVEALTATFPAREFI